ncbi:IMP-specific 5'-nucleotidase 1 [Physcia stellaris]|nr:IMP-specific 5'-nucleotidase 1 [Physcia stellaris]
MPQPPVQSNMALPKSMKMRSVEGEIEVPSPGFGTWAFGDNSWSYDATLHALKAGCRHIDCAWHYGVDEEVGRAIRDSEIPRNEIFVTSKFWPHFGAPENVEKCLDLCLKNMGLDYIDLFLAHWPVVLKARSNINDAKAFPGATDAEKAIATATDGQAIVDWAHCCQNIAADNGHKGSFVPTWQSMQRLVGTRKVRAVGVSNFSIAQLQEIISVGGSVPVSCNQVEAHPYFPNTRLLDFMKEKGILRVVYCPFAGQKKDGVPLLQDPLVLRLSEKNEMAAGQLPH